MRLHACWEQGKGLAKHWERGGHGQGPGCLVFGGGGRRLPCCACVPHPRGRVDSEPRFQGGCVGSWRQAGRMWVWAGFGAAASAHTHAFARPCSLTRGQPAAPQLVPPRAPLDGQVCARGGRHAHQLPGLCAPRGGRLGQGGSAQVGGGLVGLGARGGQGVEVEGSGAGCRGQAEVMRLALHPRLRLGASGTYDAAGWGGVVDARVVGLLGQGRRSRCTRASQARAVSVLSP